MNVMSTHNYNIDEIRKEFPIFEQEIYGKPLTFLDSAASAQKPKAVIEAIENCYSNEYSNIHRGGYYLSQALTSKYEVARDTVKNHIGAKSSKEIIFVRGATEAINLVAQTWGRENLGSGDEIILSQMEHHSNIVPWQMLRDEKDLTITVSPIDDKANFLLDEYEQLLSEKTKLVAITHISNALGTITPIKEIIKLAHKVGALVLVDGCQALPHMGVDVADLDADFYVFSGHKMYGPTGVGVLYAKENLLENMPPYQGGGDMIRSVTFDKTTFNGLPHKFEAGTPNIAGGIGFAAAIEYVNALGLENIHGHEQMLLDYALGKIESVDGMELRGQADQMAGILSFTMKAAHPHDIGTILDKMGIAIAKLVEEDPTLRVRTDEETGQTVLSGMGELHLDILVDRIKREFSVDANIGQPQVAYRETFRNTIDENTKFVRQTGGKGQYGHVVIEFTPTKPGEGSEFVSEIVGGVIPKEYFRAIEQGIKESMQNGIIAGFPVVDVKSRLHFGSTHDVDSSEMAFKIAASMCFKDAMRKSNPALLEPVVAVEVITPEEYMGDVMGDLSSRRGKVGGMTTRSEAQVINAMVPLSEMFGYATRLRSMSQGRANFTMTFDHYDEVPKSILEDVVAKSGKGKVSA